MTKQQDRSDSRRRRESRALRLAHRGDWRVGPENSLAAMRAALANPNCDGLEFDVRTARDGTPIVLHDPTLSRVQGRPDAAAHLTPGELAAFGVPTLAEVLEATGPEPFLDVEIKGNAAPAMVDVLERFRGATLERAVVSSFEGGTLDWFRRTRPAWPTWLNIDDLTASAIRDAVELQCRGVAVEWRALTRAKVVAAESAGLDVAGWTVRRRPTADRLDRLGVTAICVEAAALDG